MQSSSERSTVATSPEAQPDLASEHSPNNGPPWLRPPLKIVMLSVVFLLLLLGLAFLIDHKSRAVHRESPISVQKSAAARTLRLKGTTEAIQSRAILAPVLSGQQVGSLTITSLASAGS